MYVNGSSYKNCTETVNYGITLVGEFVNQYWKLTNQINCCRLHNNAGSAYYNFAANILYANTSLQVNTTANISSSLSVGTSASIGSTLSAGGLTTSRNYDNYGETLTYTVGYNSGPDSGWFWTTNGYWTVTGGAYLRVYVRCTGISNCEW